MIMKLPILKNKTLKLKLLKRLQQCPNNGFMKLLCRQRPYAQKDTILKKMSLYTFSLKMNEITPHLKRRGQG